MVSGEMQGMGQTAVVFGASGGIGFAIARQLLERPEIERVWGTFRNRDRAAALLTLADQSGDRLRAIPMDGTDEQSIAAVAAAIAATTPQVDLALNCIGILHDQDRLQPEKSLRQIERDRLLRYFEINSIPSLLLGKQFADLFRGNRRSVFACISAKIGSIQDNQLGGWYGYRASKAALNMYLKTLAIEYARKCPRAIVLSLHPGTTDTPLSKPFQRNVPPDKLFSCDRAAAQLLALCDRATPADSGCFFSWDGTPLPW